MRPTYSKLLKVKCPSHKPALCFRSGFCCTPYEYCDRIRASCEPCFPSNWPESQQKTFCQTSQNVSDLNDPTCAGACLSKFGPSLPTQGIWIENRDTDWWPWLSVGLNVFLLVVCITLIICCRKELQSIARNLYRCISRKKEPAAVALVAVDCPNPIADADKDKLSVTGIRRLRSQSDEDDAHTTTVLSAPNDDGDEENDPFVISQPDVESYENQTEGVNNGPLARVNLTEGVNNGPLARVNLTAGVSNGPLARVNLTAGVNNGPLARVNQTEGVSNGPLSPEADRQRNMSVHMPETNSTGPALLATGMSSRGTIPEE